MDGDIIQPPNVLRDVGTEIELKIEHSCIQFCFTPLSMYFGGRQQNVWINKVKWKLKAPSINITAVINKFPKKTKLVPCSKRT